MSEHAGDPARWDGTWGELPALDGTLLLDGGSLAAAADDFGHLVSRTPGAVLRPGSEADVVAMVRWCAARGVRLAARGAGHGAHGQAQVDGGLVIETAPLASIGAVDPGTVTVGAGATWRAVLEATLPHGLTPPVFTDYLDVSVGGTLSVGGLGGQSHAHGAQSDNVTALRVVTGAGEPLSCSATEHPGLFHAALAGLGQCAVIVEATLRLVPAPVSVRRYVLPYADLRTFLEDQAVLASDHRFDYLEGQVLPAAGPTPARYLLEAVAYGPPAGPEPEDAVLLRGLRYEDGGPAGRPEISDLGHLDFLDRLAPGIAELKALGLWSRPHPWLNLLLPGRHAAALAAPLLDALTAEALGPGGLILLYPLIAGRFGTPLLRMPDDPVPYLLAVLRTVPSDAGVVARVLADNREVARALRTAGGLVYPVGAVPFTPADWRAQYGDSWPEFEAARHRYDPHGLLTPGQGVFG